MIDKAEKAEDWRAAPAAARELRGCLELLAKLNGELQPKGTRVAINFGDITKIDIHALTNEQLEALCERLEADRKAEIAGMTAAEIDAELAEIVFNGIPDVVSVREEILFDEVTVPPGLGYEANKRCDPKEPWRNASPSDRYRMLAAAWKRETGEDLVERLEDLGPRAIMEIGFDFADCRDWMAWPRVRLRHIKRQPAGPEPQILPPVS